MDQTKQILAVLREGDFAHPGEIEAIELAFSSIAKNSTARLLDVGCGLGGTAHYIQKEGWGRVTGIDIDKELIAHAQSHYPEVQFVCKDILESDGLLPHKFQYIYSFTAFFCFASQEQALKVLAQHAAPSGTLVLFDYSKKDDGPIESRFPWSKTAFRFSPIYLPELKKQFAATGWHFTESMDISEHFIRWYTELLHKFEQKRDQVEQQFSAQAWDTLYTGYQQLLTDLTTQKVGGTIVYAIKS